MRKRQNNSPTPTPSSEDFYKSKKELISSIIKKKTKEIIGTCVSMGITVEGKKPQEIQKAIDEGKYDSKFQI